MLTTNELTKVSGVIPTLARPDMVDIQAAETIAADNLWEGVEIWLCLWSATTDKTWH